MASIYELCQWLETTRLASAIAESPWWFPAIESVHVIAISLVVGSIAVVDLRLLGMASKNMTITRITDEILPFTWKAFAVAALSGALLFSSNATTYYSSTPFRTKMALLLLAGLNMAIFHSMTYRKVREWNEAARTPSGARIAGALSLLLWIGVVTCGRLTGFVELQDETDTARAEAAVLQP